MSVAKIIRNSVAGALIAALPVSTSLAAVRPNAAVPMAGSTAVSAQDYDDDDGYAGIAWPAIAIIVLALILAIWIAVDDDPNGSGTLSRA